jgi:hypothetical protein
LAGKEGVASGTAPLPPLIFLEIYWIGTVYSADSNLVDFM